MATGLDLLPGSIVDQHFMNRNRKPRLMKAISDPDPGVAKRAFDAMMTMKKIDVAKIEAACRG